jgi:hypothetical protein
VKAVSPSGGRGAEVAPDVNRSLQELPDHHDALDLVGALVDLVILASPHALDGVVLDEAGTDEQRTACTVTFIATSAAKHLAAAPKKDRSGSLRSDLAAAT